MVTRAGKRIALIVLAPRANGAALREVFRQWQGNAAFDDVFVADVAAAREAVSAELGTDPGRAAAQRAFLDDVLAVVPLADYDRAVAEHHAALLAHTHRTGNRRGVHDLITT